MASFKTADGKTVSVSDDWALPPEKLPEESAPKAAANEAPADTSVAKAPETGVVHTGKDGKPPGPAEGKAIGKTEDKPEGTGTAAAPEEPPYRPESAFLFEIHEGACKLFGTVLGPLSNAAHKDHFHYDLAARNAATIASSGALPPSR